MALVQEEISSDTLIGHTTFLSDLHISKLRKVASDLKIPTSITMKKVELIDAIMECTKDYEGEIRGDENVVFDIYEVRYIGPQGMNVQNSNSTVSRNEYKFNRDNWLEVLKVDFDMYYKKISNSVESGVLSHWQVRKRNKFGNVKNFFATAINTMLSRKPKELLDLPHMDTEKVSILKQMNIRSFQQLLSLPRQHVAERLKLTDPQVLDMVEEARRGIA